MLALCDSPLPGAAHVVTLPLSDGQRYLVIFGHPALPTAGCDPVPLDIDADQVRWLGALALPEEGNEPPLALTVREDGAITGIDWQKPVPSQERRDLVPLREILPAFGARAFGQEDRASASASGATIAVTCAQGNSPAGLLIPLGKPAAGADLKLILDLDATPGFQAQVVDAGLEANDGGRQIIHGVSRFETYVPRASSLNLVVNCPMTDGVLKIRRGRVEAARALMPPRVGAWVWNANSWKVLGEALIGVSLQMHIAQLYISVPVKSGNVEDPKRLAAFIAAAHSRGLQIFAVEGDPGMIWGDGIANALSRAAALAAYNRQSQPSERLDGLQYDIEPYLQPGFVTDSELFWRKWAKTLEALGKTYRAATQVVVPYWMLASPGGEKALELLRPHISDLVIMAYRTAPSETIEAAAPLLSWATKYDLPTQVALESGILAQEYNKVYVKAPEGDLHVIRFDDVAAVVLFDRVRKSGAGRAFRLSHVVASKTDRITFTNNTAALLRAADILERNLVAWPAFRGLALHGLNELTPEGLSASGLGVAR